MHRLCILVGSLALGFVLAASARADLVISMRTSSSSAILTFSGTGTIGEDFSGILDFNNFGPVFDSLHSGQNEFIFDAPIRIDVFRPLSTNNLVRVYDRIRFDNQIGSDDIALLSLGTSSFNAGDVFTFNSTASINGDFSLVPLGNFTADSSGDAGSERFGSVSLNVSAVPEPSTLLFLSAGGICYLAKRPRKRAKDKKST